MITLLVQDEISETLLPCRASERHEAGNSHKYQDVFAEGMNKGHSASGCKL
jgi:hypothetical protein